jgi:hypothetical protein
MTFVRLLFRKTRFDRGKPFRSTSPKFPWSQKLSHDLKIRYGAYTYRRVGETAMTSSQHELRVNDGSSTIARTLVFGWSQAGLIGKLACNKKHIKWTNEVTKIVPRQWWDKNKLRFIQWCLLARIGNGRSQLFKKWILILTWRRDLPSATDFFRNDPEAQTWISIQWYHYITGKYFFLLLGNARGVDIRGKFRSLLGLRAWHW